MVWYGQNAGCALYFCNLSSELKETFDLQRPCGPKRRQKNNLKSNWQMFAETGVFRQFNNFFLPPHTNYSRPGKHPRIANPSVHARCVWPVAGGWVALGKCQKPPPAPPHTHCATRQGHILLMTMLLCRLVLSAPMPCCWLHCCWPIPCCWPMPCSSICWPYCC